MREFDLGEQIEGIAFARAETGAHPFSDTIDRQYGRLIERRRIERGGRVRFMMVGKDDLSIIIKFFTDQFF